MYRGRVKSNNNNNPRNWKIVKVVYFSYRVEPKNVYCTRKARPLKSTKSTSTLGTFYLICDMNSTEGANLDNIGYMRIAPNK